MGTFYDPVAQVPTSLSGSTASFTASVSQVTLAAANQRRKGVTFYNDRSSSATWYLTLGTTASSTQYTVELRPTDYYEVPYGYLGQVTGVATSTTGSLRVTEVT